MIQTTYLVTGAARGIGKGLVEELSQVPTNRIYATTRKPMDFGKSNVTNVVLELTDLESIKAAAAEIKELDVLVANAAIGSPERLLSTSVERFQEYLDTNVVGVHRIVNTFLPALRAGTTKKIVIVSSGAGSLTIQKDFMFGAGGPYATSKAANNMQAIQYHNELRHEGFTVVPINPGWVATDMGSQIDVLGDRKPMSIAKSTTNVTKLINGLKAEDSGKFFDHDGTSLPW